MLALSTKYALKALLFLARNQSEEFMLVRALSEEAEVPGPYLSKIIKQLAAKQLVETRRGILGGVRFPKNRPSITFYDVCVALDDPIVSQGCFLTKHPCTTRSPCVMHSHWTRIKSEVAKFLQESKIE
ncbi:MAG: Rrf2 family transcriptional regulator [Deltaproteobacteria bacterium]|nr:Rrf2 family transcriptional regulator [Deltaproteobacteria bacterium]